MRPVCRSTSVVLCMNAEGGRVDGFERLSFTKIHVYAARQAGIEAAYRAHDVDTLELIRPVLLEDGCILHRILVRPRCPIHIPRVGVPGGGWIGMIVGDLTVPDHNMMREYAAYGLMEATADGFVGHFEFRPGSSATGMQLLQRLFGEVQSGGRGISLEVGARAIALDGVTPLRYLPLELDLGQ